MEKITEQRNKIMKQIAKYPKIENWEKDKMLNGILPIETYIKLRFLTYSPSMEMANFNITYDSMSVLDNSLPINDKLSKTFELRGLSLFGKRKIKFEGEYINYEEEIKKWNHLTYKKK